MRFWPRAPIHHARPHRPTPIYATGMEHVAALGGSLRSIAQAKAGILRPGRPLVLAAQRHAEAAEVVLAAAAAGGCPVVRADQAVRHASCRTRGPMRATKSATTG